MRLGAKSNSRCIHTCFCNKKISRITLRISIHLSFFKKLNAISTIIKETGNNTFIKKHVEDLEPKACGNNPQYSRAALDIFKYAGVIQKIYPKGKFPIYTLGNKKPLIRMKNHRLDEYLDVGLSFKGDEKCGSKRKNIS